MIVKKENKECIAIASSILLNKGIIIIPTDTIYGFSALMDKEEKIAELKNRDIKKHFIYLIENKEYALPYIELSFYSKKELSHLFSFWPAPLTIIFKSNIKEGSIAFRAPKDEWLQKLLHKIKTPIASTSANISGFSTIEDVEVLKTTFEESVDLIVDGGRLAGTSSTILDARERPFKVLRQGSYKVECLDFDPDRALL